MFGPAPEYYIYTYIYIYIYIYIYYKHAGVRHPRAHLRRRPLLVPLQLSLWYNTIFISIIYIYYVILYYIISLVSAPLHPRVSLPAVPLVRYNNFMAIMTGILPDYDSNIIMVVPHDSNSNIIIAILHNFSPVGPPPHRRGSLRAVPVVS